MYLIILNILTVVEFTAFWFVYALFIYKPEML
jgi:hypothetical protein